MSLRHTGWLCPRSCSTVVAESGADRFRVAVIGPYVECIVPSIGHTLPNVGGYFGRNGITLAVLGVISAHFGSRWAIFRITRTVVEVIGAFLNDLAHFPVNVMKKLSVQKSNQVSYRFV